MNADMLWVCETCNLVYCEYQFDNCQACARLRIKARVRQYTHLEYARRRIKKALKYGHITEAAAIADDVLDLITMTRIP